MNSLWWILGLHSGHLLKVYGQMHWWLIQNVPFSLYKRTSTFMHLMRQALDRCRTNGNHPTWIGKFLRVRLYSNCQYRIGNTRESKNWEMKLSAIFLMSSHCSPIPTTTATTTSSFYSTFVYHRPTWTGSWTRFPPPTTTTITTTTECYYTYFFRGDPSRPESVRRPCNLGKIFQKYYIEKVVENLFP